MILRRDKMDRVGWLRTAFLVVLFFCAVSAGVVWRLVAQEDAASTDWDGDGFEDGTEEAWGTSDVFGWMVAG